MRFGATKNSLISFHVVLRENVYDDRKKRCSNTALCSSDCTPLGTVSLTGLRASVHSTVRLGEISMGNQSSKLRVIREPRARPLPDRWQKCRSLASSVPSEVSNPAQSSTRNRNSTSSERRTTRRVSPGFGSENPTGVDWSGGDDKPSVDRCLSRLHD